MGKQIYDLLVVKFQHGDLDQKLNSWSAIDGVDDVLEGSGDDSFLFVIVFVTSLHSVRFSCSCLPICEDSTIVPLQNALDNG